LAANAGRPVTIDTLIERVWADAPPVEACNVPYSHLSRIRRLARHAATPCGNPVRLERRHAGYVLDVALDLMDLYRFPPAGRTGRSALGRYGSDRRVHGGIEPVAR
jgi:DNA-binding SARP family transcriptional activator